MIHAGVAWRASLAGQRGHLPIQDWPPNIFNDEVAQKRTWSYADRNIDLADGAAQHSSHKKCRGKDTSSVGVRIVHHIQLLATGPTTRARARLWSGSISNHGL
jgi:hypothetical protein